MSFHIKKNQNEHWLYSIQSRCLLRSAGVNDQREMSFQCILGFHSRYLKNVMQSVVICPNYRTVLKKSIEARKKCKMEDTSETFSIISVCIYLPTHDSLLVLKEMALISGLCKDTGDLHDFLVH